MRSLPRKSIMAKSKRNIQIHDEDYAILAGLRQKYKIPIIRIHAFILGEFDYSKFKKPVGTNKKQKKNLGKPVGKYKNRQTNRYLGGL